MPEAIKQLYVFYAFYGGNDEYINIMDKQKYDIFNGGQPTDDRIHRATIHNDSTSENDPIIDIIAITELPELSEDNIRYISQTCINWLFDNGHMDKRE